MTDAISSVSGSSSSSASSTSSVLSNETKSKLKALGLDPADYTSESAAKSAIAEATAKKAQEAQQTQSQSKPQRSGVLETVETNTKELASKMGISISTEDKLADIFDKISTKIDELQASAGTDASKKTDASGYKSEYSILYSEYSQATATQNMTGASALASYNKAALGLS